jgi:hypothetical protein
LNPYILTHVSFTIPHTPVLAKFALDTFTNLTSLKTSIYGLYQLKNIIGLCCQHFKQVSYLKIILNHQPENPECTSIETDYDKIAELIIKTRITHIKIIFGQKRIPTEGVIKLIKRCRWVRFTVRNIVDGYMRRFKVGKLIKWQSEIQNTVF